MNIKPTGRKKKKEHHQIKEHEHHRNVSQSSIVIHAKRATSKAAVLSKKLLHSTGKAAWIASTTFLILAVPFIIKMDHDQQLTEIKLQPRRHHSHSQMSVTERDPFASFFFN